MTYRATKERVLPHCERYVRDTNRFHGGGIGDYLQSKHERNMEPPLGNGAPGYAIVARRHAGLRFCETCMQYKPRDKSRTNKGWKCSDCKGK